MASFLAGDSPVADFDYDLPAAADSAAVEAVWLMVAGQRVNAEASTQALTGTWDTLTLPAVGRYPIFAVAAGGDPAPVTVDGGNAASQFEDTLDGGDASTVYPEVYGREQRALVDWLVVVDPEDQWHNVITARAEWEGAPKPDGTLDRLLEVARDQVEAYAPDLGVGVVPERLRAAQLMQARNTWNASLTNGDQQTDVGGFVVTIRPLDWAVKQLIRPLTATKAFG